VSYRIISRVLLIILSALIFCSTGYVYLVTGV
jgi:hypothetical protein